MNDEGKTRTLWVKFKVYIFMKLGYSLWQYVIIHTDYWDHAYGVSFTHKRDFPKLFKYDIADMDDDLEVETEKDKNKGSGARMVVMG